MKTVIVVGAGPAGLFAAIAAAKRGADVTVLERNPFAGKKLRITGKGRCNVTNNASVREVIEAVTANPKFLYSALNRMTPSDVMAFFEAAGVPLKTERGRRVFPVSDRAADIAEALLRETKSAGARLVFESRVTGLAREEDGRWRVTAAERGHERVRTAQAVILATGGVSYPGTGSTGDGHRMLEALGARITELRPSLVPIETREDFAPLSGLTLKNVVLTVRHGGSEVFSEMGEMLFAHFGVTGPLVLSASANMGRYPLDSYRITVNFKPALGTEELDRRVRSDFEKYAARDLINSLGDLLPKAVIPFAVAQSGIDPRKKTGAVTKEERAALEDALTAFRITPKAFRPVAEAIVTAGGADVRDIDPKTMEFKALPGLYAAGELLDVSAYTGGYNLQIAFSTGNAAGLAAGAADEA